MRKDNLYDVVIIGGGPAGCSAAVVLARSGRSTLILDEGKQRNLSSRGMHNYLTRDGIAPAEYLKIAHEELKHYQVGLIKTTATDIAKLEDKGFKITDQDNNIYLCRRVLLATGVTDNIPNIPGMKELWGCSVHHCHYCDGYECADNIIGVYSKNYNGYGMAMALRHISNRVILFTDGSRYLKPKQRLHLEGLKIEVVSKRITQLVYTDKTLTHVELQNGEQIECQSLFVNHGHRVNSTLLEKLNCNCTKKGAAVTNRKQETNIKGLYVAGDASYDMHFVVVAAAEGVKAAVAIHNDLLHTANEI
jgi:thioredoxin reductase